MWITISFSSPDIEHLVEVGLLLTLVLLHALKLDQHLEVESESRFSQARSALRKCRHMNIECFWRGIKNKILLFTHINTPKKEYWDVFLARKKE